MVGGGVGVSIFWMSMTEDIMVIYLSGKRGNVGER